MNKIPYDEILNIQRKVNIVDVIQNYLPVEKKGKNYFAICPFHDDHNPSLSISPEKQIYTCFVCGASGNVFNFVMNYENISFTSAVIKVANLVGINLDIKQDKKEIVKSNKYDSYYKIFNIVSKYYQNNLNSVYGTKALEYLEKRNIKKDVIKEFEIGLSLNDNLVSKLLSSKGYDLHNLEELGLCGVKDKFLYDIFRNRIMFPLKDSLGNVVGFSGRIYNGEKDSKYINSKESVIFKKGKTLYNYKNASKEANERKQIIIVEGFMDVIRLYTIGIKNVVATMGTAITKDHVSLIMKLSKNVVLLFDGDKAGEKATISAVDEFSKVNIDPKIIRLEDNLDPDDYIIKKGKDAFLMHLNNPISKLDFVLNIKKSKIDFKDYNEISNYIKDAAKEISKIDDKIVYELTIKRLSKETNVDVDTIKMIIGNSLSKKKEIVYKPRKLKMNKYELAENYLIHYMLRDPNAILVYQNNVSYLSSKNLNLLAVKILEFYEKNRYINVTDFTVFLEDDEALINEVLKIDSIKLPDKVDVNVIKEYIKTIDDGIIKSEIKNIKEKISVEQDVAKKIILLEKLAMLKKREC